MRSQRGDRFERELLKCLRALNSEGRIKGREGRRKREEGRIKEGKGWEGGREGGGEEDTHHHAAQKVMI